MDVEDVNWERGENKVDDQSHGEKEILVRTYVNLIMSLSRTFHW